MKKLLISKSVHNSIAILTEHHTKQQSKCLQKDRNCLPKKVTRVQLVSKYGM